MSILFVKQSAREEVAFHAGGEGRKSAEKGDSGKPLRNIIVLYLC